MALSTTPVQSATSTAASGNLTSPTLSSGATAGNLLVLTAARSATHSSGGAWPSVSGFTLVHDSGVNNGNMGGAMWYKVAAGSETTVSFSGETNPAGNWTCTLAEYGAPASGWNATPLAVKAEDESGLSGTGTTQSSGTTSANSVAEAFAVALFAIDGGGNFGTESYTNSYVTSVKTTSGGRAGHVQASRVLSATGTHETTITVGTGDERYGCIAVFEADAGDPPSVTPDTADGATFTTATPTLLFTGTDADADDIVYEIQIADNADFNTGTVVLDSWQLADGTPFTIHPQPRGSTTWNGQEQVDDRPCQSFDSGGGGILDSIDMLAVNDSGADSISGRTFSRLYAHAGTYGTSSTPANPAAQADTPTPDWLAITDDRTWNDTESASPAWYQHDCTGANRIQLLANTKYVVQHDWDADTGVASNDIGLRATDGGSHGGNGYIDGDSSNYGVQASYDIAFRVRAVQTLYVDAVSDTDAGFVNQDNGGDTNPFTSGDQIGYTVQGGDALSNGVYYWRVRGSDGTAFGDWSATRSFTVNVTPPSGNRRRRFFMAA